MLCDGATRAVINSGTIMERVEGGWMAGEAGIRAQVVGGFGEHGGRVMAALFLLWVSIGPTLFRSQVNSRGNKHNGARWFNQ